MHYVFILVAIIDIFIFFTSFITKKKLTVLHRYFFKLYVAVALSIFLLLTSYYLEYTNVFIQGALVLLFQGGIICMHKMNQIYIEETQNTFTKYSYLFPWIYAILLLVGTFTNQIATEFVFLLIELTNITLLIISFFKLIVKLFNTPQYFNLYTIMYTITLLLCIILSPAIVSLSNVHGFEFGPLILSTLFYVVYLVIIRNQSITNISLSLPEEFDLIPASIVLIDSKGKLLEYNARFIQMFHKFSDNDNDFFEYFDFLKRIIDTEGVNQFKFYLNEVESNKETETFVKRFLYEKKYYIYTVTISPVYFKNSLNFLIVLTEGEEKEISHDELENTLSSKFETLGKLADSVITDINTPITNIKTNLSILKTDKHMTEEDIEFIEMMDTSADKINILTTTMKNHFRNSSHYKNESFDLLDLLINIEALTENDFKKKNCTLVLSAPESLIIYGIPSKLSQVLLNIISNSLKAYSNISSQDTKKILLKVSTTQKNVVISIKDFAGGIDKNIQPYIFNEILTTKVIDGFGLGLYVSHNIIREDFNGKIEFSVEEGKSTTMKISLPITK